jgi:hypothetical protein
MLRAATELSRDVRKIAQNTATWDSWLLARMEGGRDAGLGWDDSTNPEKTVHRVYEIASDFGTHGHLSDRLLPELVHFQHTGQKIASITGHVDSLIYASERAASIWLLACPLVCWMWVQPMQKRFPYQMKHADP